jgi:hypothetical protein
VPMMPSRISALAHAAPSKNRINVDFIVGIVH